MQKSGWIVGIMIEHARSIQAMCLHDCVGPMLDREDLRAMIMDNTQVMLGNGKSELSDNLAPDERVYWISEKFAGGRSIPKLRFVAPSGQKIRRIKAERVEQNKKAKAARMERSEIAKSLRGPTKAAIQLGIATQIRRKRL
jgi:hypothetical protein